MKVQYLQLFETLRKLKNKGYVALISLMAEDLTPSKIQENTHKSIKLIYTLYNPVNKGFEEIETIINNEIQSVVTLYKSAKYDEMEIYSQFGINFKKHPNLQKIF